MRKPRILCFASYFLPGFKSGGPVRSLLNMREWLGDDYDFMVVTRDRDIGDSHPYAGRTPKQWHTVDGWQVWYLPPPCWVPVGILQALRDSRPDLLYFQSSLDPCLTIMPLMLRRMSLIPSSTPVLVAPRGELSPGARSIKRRKKAAYFPVARALGLYRNVTWHATSQMEAEEVKGLWGQKARVHIGPNLPSKIGAAVQLRTQIKKPGSLRLVFLSRVSRKKNLHGALDFLSGVKSQVQFDIYGTREDPKYWQECIELISRLPGNIKATFRGAVPPNEAIATLSNYDVFLLPTLGENFGHVVLEALLAGCPVVLSDQTPWRGLSDRRAGFDIPLSQTSRFQQVIEEFATMGRTEFDEWSAGAREYGNSYSNNTDLAQLTRSMLEGAIRR